MTPSLASNREYLSPGHASAAHLTDERLATLLAAKPGRCNGDEAVAEAHLLSCERCATEFGELRESLSLFRETSVACANTVLAGRTAGRHREWVVPARSPHPVHPAFWVAAAAMLLTAVLLPMQLRRHAVPSSIAMNHAVSSGESDEALLEDVNRDLSASVPSPMQALVDPTGGDDSALLLTPIPTSDPIAITPSVTLTPVQRKN